MVEYVCDMCGKREPTTFRLGQIGALPKGWRRRMSDMYHFCGDTCAQSFDRQVSYVPKKQLRKRKKGKKMCCR